MPLEDHIQNMRYWHKDRLARNDLSSVLRTSICNHAEAECCGATIRWTIEASRSQTYCQQKAESLPQSRIQCVTELQRLSIPPAEAETAASVVANLRASS